MRAAAEEPCRRRAPELEDHQVQSSAAAVRRLRPERLLPELQPRARPRLEHLRPERHQLLELASSVPVSLVQRLLAWHRASLARAARSLQKP